jgi:Zn-dependent M28 family amino/carboxypeptidase
MKFTLTSITRNLLTITLTTVLFTSACSQQYEINVEDVTNDISYLASDDLKGRGLFSPELDQAAEYIAASFLEAGLKPLEPSGFKQSFDLYSLKMEEASLSLNGQRVESDNYFVQMDLASISWDESAEVIVTIIGPDDDFRGEMGRISRNDDNLIVLVDTTHTEGFSRYQRYFTRGSNLLALGENRSVAYVLTTETEVDNYTLTAEAEVTTHTLTNVVGYVPGTRTNEYVLFSGHYDHIGIRRAIEGDSIANGANDDASGVVGVMALARYFASGPKPERSILFAAFTAEESGGYGSKYFSEALNPDEIVAMFNLEMIGKPAKEGPNTAWVTGWDKSDFGQLLQKSAEGSIYTFYPDPYPTQNLFYRSDNATLAKLGVPAHSISTTQIDIDEDYHQVSDEVETLDLDHLTNTVKAVGVAAEQMIRGEDTPTRVNPNDI